MIPYDEIVWSGADGRGARVSGTFAVGNYPSGEPLVTFEQEAEVETILARPRTFAAFVGVLFFVDAMADRGFDAPNLILPFVPGARQDRLNSAGDYLFTAKSVAGMINARRFPSVTVLDPHSDVISGLIDRCLVEHVDPLHSANLPRGINSYAAIVSPDAGAEKRAGAIARKHGLPLLRAWKTRDVSSGQISGFGLEPTTPYRIAGRHVLVVDDICDGGGTFEGLADVIAGRGLTADLFVTHGLFTKGPSSLLCRYRNVSCTDSVLVERPGVNELPICQSHFEGR